MKEMRKPAPPEMGSDADEKPATPGARREPAPRVALSSARRRQRMRQRMRRQMTRQPPFRSRLFAMLLLFAVIPTVAVTLLWTGTASRALSLMSASSAWERVARSGESALAAARTAPLTAVQQHALTAHETELRQSLELAKRFDFVANRTIRLIALGALVVVGLIAVGASRVAGHLSRQLSRPLDELVGWTRLIRGGRAIPDQTERRGAPEFEVLRTSMRTMAHELENPLTPIRFAVDRLRRSAPQELRDTVEVLAEESARLEAMAKSFAQFGRLPDGPAAEIDVGELVTRTVRNAVPERVEVELVIDEGLPLVIGYHEPLVRAVANVLLNAVDACPTRGRIAVRVARDGLSESPAIVIAVRDTGVGIAPDVLARIFDPYVTTKPGGTGLGLAIARQTMAAHRGDITATSTVGVGTEMRLRLPLAGVDHTT
jgi:signal transduction histidine kinase